MRQWGFVHEKLKDFCSWRFPTSCSVVSISSPRPCFTKSMLRGGDPSSWMGDANHVAALVGSSRARIVLDWSLLILIHALVTILDARIQDFPLRPQISPESSRVDETLWYLALLCFPDPWGQTARSFMWIFGQTSPNGRWPESGRGKD